MSIPKNQNRGAKSLTDFVLNLREWIAGLSARFSQYLPLSGGTMTGPIKFSPVSNNNTDAAELASAESIFSDNAQALSWNGGQIRLHRSTGAPLIAMHDSLIEHGVIPEKSWYSAIDFFDKNNQRLANIEYAHSSNGLQAIQFTLTKIGTTGTYGFLGIRCKADGTFSTIAPTPPVTDDSTQIATTAFVKDVTATRPSSYTQITLDSVTNNTSTSWISMRTVTPTYSCWVRLHCVGGVSGTTTRACTIYINGTEAARNAEQGTGREFGTEWVFCPANATITWQSVMCTTSNLRAVRAY